MDAKTLKALETAGLSAETILAVIKADIDRVDPAPEEQPPAEPESPEAPAAPAESASPAETAYRDALLSAIEKLIGTIQASNIIGTGRPSAASQADAVDSVLTEIFKGGK